MLYNLVCVFTLYSLYEDRYFSINSCDLRNFPWALAISEAYIPTLLLYKTPLIEV